MIQIQRYALTFRNWLNQPQKVFITCLFVLMISLFLNGTVWKVWGLYRDQAVIKEQIANSEQMTKNFESQMLRAKEASFIEHQAREKMDLVSENDLVFVFPE
jgi:cell division protein FtsB